MDVDEDEDGTQRPRQVLDYGIQVDFESIDVDNLEDPSDAAARFDKDIAEKKGWDWTNGSLTWKLWKGRSRRPIRALADDFLPNPYVKKIKFYHGITYSDNCLCFYEALSMY